MPLRMHDLDNAYREAFVDAWANSTGVEPHEAGLLSVFHLGAGLTEISGHEPATVDETVETLESVIARGREPMAASL